MSGGEGGSKARARLLLVASAASFGLMAVLARLLSTHGGPRFGAGQLTVVRFVVGALVSLSSSLTADEATMVAMVKSRSVIALSTPFGRVTALMCSESPMSRPARLITISSGISAASQISSSSWRTWLSTPPRLMPRDLSSSTKWIGTSTCTLACSEMRRKSTWSGRSVTGWNWTSFGRVRTAAFEAPSIITTVFMKWPVLSALTKAFSSRWIERGSSLLP